MYVCIIYIYWHISPECTLILVVMGLSKPLTSTGILIHYGPTGQLPRRIGDGVVHAFYVGLLDGLLDGLLG